MNKLTSLAGLIGLALGCTLAVSSANAQAPQGAPPSLPLPPGVTKEAPASLPAYNLYRPTDIKAGTKLPIIVWANGGCAPRDDRWSPMLAGWAGAGYFVLSINDPNAPMRGRGAGGAPGAAPAPGAPPAPAPGAGPGAGAARAGGAPGGGTGGANGAAALQKAAIDWAIKQNASGPFADKIDATRIAASGNSCGGMSSLTLASTDTRVKSIFILSGSSLGPNADADAVAAMMGKVTAPVLIVVGGAEDIARIPANTDCGVIHAGTPCVVVQRSSGDHGVMSTDMTVQPIAAEIGLNWFRATLFKDKAATETLNTKICAQCDPAVWTVNKKNFGTK